VAVFEILVLMGAGVVSGWVNTLAGAGGLVAIPALLFTGLSAPVANGTLRIAIIVQCLVGAAGFRRAEQLPGRPLAAILPVVVLGGALGAVVATHLPSRALEIIQLVVMVVMALALLVRASWFLPKLGEPHRGMSSAAMLGLLFAGFYGGLVLVAVLCGVMRFDLVRGNAIKLAATLMFNLVTLGIFAAADQVAWRRGAWLALGSALGALLAVRFALRHGQQAIRWVLIVAVLAAAVALALR
jgi:uncharacterized protein